MIFYIYKFYILLIFPLTTAMWTSTVMMLVKNSKLYLINEDIAIVCMINCN